MALQENNNFSMCKTCVCVCVQWLDDKEMETTAVMKKKQKKEPVIGS